VVSQRTLAGQQTRVVCPLPIVGAVEELLGAAARLERGEYRYRIEGLAPGGRVDVGKDLAVEAFAVDHGIDSLGYHLLRTRRRLRPELRGEAGAAIAARRRAGETVEESRQEIWLSYTGDTGPGVFALEPRLAESRVLLLECTFLGEENRARAAQYHHLHLDDLAAFAAGSRNEAIVLYHLSRRHALAELRRQLEDRLPGIAARVHLLGEEA
jgi:ribonuclease Z